MPHTAYPDFLPLNRLPNNRASPCWIEPMKQIGLSSLYADFLICFQRKYIYKFNNANEPQITQKSAEKYFIVKVLKT